MARRRKTLANSDSTNEATANQQGKPAAEAPQAPPPATVADFQASFERLRRRANRGNQQARAALIHYLDADPARWATFGNMARHAEMSLIEVITEGEWLAGEAIKREAARLRERLSRPNQSPLEELAITRLVGCWLQVQFVESMCKQAHEDFARAKFWLARQQQVHRLYAQAEKSLLLIRGLSSTSLPPILVPQAEASKPAMHALNGTAQEKPVAPQYDTGLQATEAGVPVNRINGVLNKVNGHGRIWGPAMAGTDN